MRRALLAAAFAALTLPVAASAKSTSLYAVSPLDDRPGGVFRTTDPIHIIAHGFYPDAVCKKVAFTLTDSSGHRFHLADVHPDFGAWGQGVINRLAGAIPATAAFGPGLIDSNQACTGLGHVRGKTTVQIIDPNQPLPVATTAGATDALSGQASTFSFHVDRYAEISVDVQYEFVPGDWRTIDSAENGHLVPAAGTYSIQWTADAGGAVPPGHYRYVLTPRAPTVGDGATITQEFDVATQVVGGLSSPAGLAFDPAGNLAVAETSANRVRTFAPNGSLVSTFSFGVLEPRDVTFIPGSTLVANASVHRIIRLVTTATQTEASEFAGPANFSPSGGPTALASTTAGGGRVYAVDGQLARVQAFGFNGALVRTLAPAGLVRPQDVIVAGDGTLWVADAGAGKLFHLSADGSLLGQVSLPSPPPTVGRRATSAPQPVDVAIDANGRLIYSDAATNRVGVLSSPVQKVGAGLLQQPAGLVTLGRSGDFLVVDTKTGRLLHYRVP